MIKGKELGPEVHTDIFVGEFVGETDSLGLVFDGPSIDDGMFELFDDRLVDGIALWTVSLDTAHGWL